jgi:lipopolysaccharide transport protein LptA
VYSPKRLLSRTVPVALLVAAVAVTLRGEEAQADPLGMVAGQALDVTAEQLDVDVAGGTAVLTGKVRAKLGDLEVACPRVEIRYDAAPEVRWARGTGGVDATFKDIHARAQVVEVDVVKRTMTLAGGVHLKRGRGWVRAEKATIDLKTRHVSLQSVKGSIPVETPDR